jgi:ribosomal protein S18 acetylase RimI-like enzyme
MKIEIRKATVKDLREIQKLNLLLCKKEKKEYDPTIIGDYPLTKIGSSYFKSRITGKNSVGFVAFVDKMVVGYVLGCISDKQPWRNISKIGSLDNMLVLQEYRNLKIGSKLAGEFFKWCKKKKIKRIVVVVAHKNMKAINFYKKNGFFDYDVVLEKKI